MSQTFTESELPWSPSQLPCVNYTAAQCPLARCQLYSVAGVNLVKLCIPQQCKSLLNQSACVGVCTWNGTMCDRTPCSKLNVDTCTPEVCVLSSDGSCSGKACASLSSDACDTTRCYVNSNGKCADQTCAMMTTSSKCASPQCYWDGSTNTCTTPPCSSYQSGCPAPRCQVTSTGACGNAPCSSWKTAVNCTVAPGCLWSNDACSDRPCQLFDATTCPIGRCQWDTSLKACTRPACSASNTSGSCPTDQCYWSSLTSTCVPIPCSQFSTNASCPVDRCYYVSSGCQDLPCSMIAQKSVCSANAACVWNVPTTATGTASASGTCKATVVDVPCAKRTDLTTCVLPQCYADASSQKCTLPPCNLYTSASSCPSDRCAFNVSGSASCAPIPCLALPSATTCALFSDRCAWDSTSGWCKPVACEQLQSCDLARCALTWSGACASIQCEAQLTKAQCPTSSYTCMWFNDQCGYGNCGLLRNQTACGTDSKCTWAVPSGSSGSCIATSFLTSLPCSALSGADLCASAPNSRCTWVTSGNSGQCTPTDLTSLLPCFNFTSQGQSACPTSYCTWWNKLCVNPLCSTASASASASACAKWNCQWVSTTSTCADQQWQQFPCEVFSAATCPAGRCSKNATGCFTPQTSSSSSTSSGLSAALAAQLTTTSDGTVINATTGVPVDATAKACLALSGDARSCLLSTGACVWTGSVCAPPPCAQFTDDACPTKRCRSASGRCMELCPQSNPYYCSSTGTCAKQASGCVTCPSSQVQCVVDSSCHTSQTSCPCPDATPNRCANDGRCVYNTSTDCDACPSSTPVKCWDGSCSSDESGCPCPLSNPLLCSDNTTCVSRVSDCDVKCPKLTPVKCWNGACATTDAACPCSENLPFRCAVDGKCYSSQAMCPCLDTTQQRCATGRCVANTTTDCVSTSTTCPSATPALCADGSCAATAALCGCASAMATQLPLIDVAQVSTTFDVTRYLELAARVNYTVCGKDWKLIVTVVWSATEALTGKAVGGTLYGRTVSVPPNVFTAGTQYIITAVAYVNGSSTSLSSSASVIMLATAPTPKVTAVGGNRTVSATNIGVAVQVNDVTRTSSDVVAWVCTGSDGVSACDSSMTSPLTSATSGFVQIAGPVPAGVYIVTAFYKGNSASMWLTVKATAVPSVQIIAPQDTTGALKQLYMYASVQNGGKASKTTWYIGGSAVVTGSVLTAAMPTTTTTVIAKACDAVDSSACGQATWNYVPVTPVTGTCSLSSTDGTASTAYTALATALSVSSTWTSTTATLKFSFYLEYTTKSGSTARIQLAPYDSEVSSLSFTAPMLSGNIAAQVTVGVVARDAGTRETIASAVCSPVALASAALTSATIVSTQTTQLANALAVNDTNAVFSAAATLASAAGQAGANASQLVSSVLGAVSSVVSSQSQDGSTLSRAARSAVLQTLSTAVNNAASAMNASQQQQAVQTVIAALTSPDSQNSVDVSADGPATLSLLSQVAASASVSVATEKLSLQLAASATLGVTSTMNASNVSIAGVAHTGDDIGGAMLNHTKCSLALPTTFNVSNTNSSSTVSLAVAQYDQSPVGTSGLSNATALKSAIAEFNVQADGNRVNVSQVWPAIRIELQVSGVVNSSMLKCQYYDKTVAAWTTTGVTTVGYDASRQVLLCDTTHLSMFGGTETTVTSGTSAPPSAATPSPVGTTSPTSSLNPVTAPSGPTASSTPTPNGGSPAPPSPGATPSPPGSPTTSSPAGTSSAPADSGPSSSVIGAVVGGCIAGLFAVVIVGFLIVRSRANIEQQQASTADSEMQPFSSTGPLTAMGQQLYQRPGYHQL